MDNKNPTLNFNIKKMAVMPKTGHLKSVGILM